MSIPAPIPAGPQREGGVGCSFAVQNFQLAGTHRKTAPGALFTTEAAEAAGTAGVLGLLCFLLPHGPSVQGPWTVQLTWMMEK